MTLNSKFPCLATRQTHYWFSYSILPVGVSQKAKGYFSREKETASKPFMVPLQTRSRTLSTCMVCCVVTCQHRHVCRGPWAALKLKNIKTPENQVFWIGPLYLENQIFLAKMQKATGQLHILLSPSKKMRNLEDFVDAQLHSTPNGKCNIG